MNNLYEKSEVEESPVRIEWPKENPYLMFARGNGKSLSILADNIMKLVVAMWEFMFDHYPNRRVVHLAIHGKRARTRKKNRNRILRYFQNEEWKEKQNK